MKEIKLGVLGGGRMAWEHCRQIVETEGLELVSLSSRSEDGRQSVQEQFPDVKLFSEHDQLLASSEIDWVVITTFTNEHKKWALEGLEQGKNLIIEKPITLNAPDTEEIFSSAKKRGLQVTVHQNRRWDRDFELVKKVLGDGRSAWVEASNNHALSLPRWTLVGTGGMMQVPGGIPEQWTEAYIRRPYGEFPREERIDINQDEFSPGFYTDFAEKISRGEVPSVRPEEVVKVNNIIDAVRDSSENKRLVSL